MRCKIALLFILSNNACAESVNGDIRDVVLVHDAAVDLSTDAPNTLDASGAVTTPTTGLVINEVSVAGDDYIELYNGGQVALLLDGLRITDRGDSGPSTDHVIDFPTGIALLQGEYFVVVADVAAPRTGLQTADCLGGMAPRYFEVEFGLSKGDGDAAFLLDAHDNVLAMVEVPANIVADGATWSAIPNGGTTFTTAPPSPGGPNMPFGED